MNCFNLFINIKATSAKQRFLKYSGQRSRTKPCACGFWQHSAIGPNDSVSLILYNISIILTNGQNPPTNKQKLWKILPRWKVTYFCSVWLTFSPKENWTEYTRHEPQSWLSINNNRYKGTRMVPGSIWLCIWGSFRGDLFGGTWVA